MSCGQRPWRVVGPEYHRLPERMYVVMNANCMEDCGYSELGYGNGRNACIYAGCAQPLSSYACMVAAQRKKSLLLAGSNIRMYVCIYVLYVCTYVRACMCMHSLRLPCHNVIVQGNCLYADGRILLQSLEIAH